MDNILISPRPVGSVRAPSSKSEAHRLLIVSALAALYGRGTAVREVRSTDMNEDIEATVRCLTALGARIERRDEILAVTPIQKVPSAPVLDCGESGSTLRFLLPVVCALGSLASTPHDFCASLVGHGRLPKRPLSPLYEELVSHGATLSPMGSNPLTVSSGITAGDYTLDGGVSSQFISGLLFALPLLQGESTV
ncbi:MAG: 3-phosphoshikimate 1-carboxyvinyltransferase, partial [Clostridia bacterium]|nr:3-phosphoshikimate 1-carboxyvinyltransferase [Clostridia bacterium]